MKRTLLLTVLALIVCFEVFGQERQTIEDNFIDEYGKIAWREEEIRLQNTLLVELNNNPDYKAYLIFSYQKNSELKLIKVRQRKIQKFFKNNNVSESRYKLVIGDNVFYRTSIWLIPEAPKLPN